MLKRAISSAQAGNATPDAHLRQADPSAAAGKQPLIAGEHDDRAAGDGVTVDCGDQRLGKRGKALENSFQEREKTPDILGPAFDQRRQIDPLRRTRCPAP